MAVESGAIIETGLAALLFAATFLVGGRVHPFRSLVRDRRSVVSFGAGMSAAYVFVHLLPELSEVRHHFVESVDAPLRFEGMGVYFLALVGFLVFYGLDHLRAQLRKPLAGEHSALSFRLHVGGFAAYAGLVSYLLVNSLGETSTSTALYAVAIAFHFLSVEYALRREYGAAFERSGRFVLAGMSILGWAVGLLFAMPPYVLALLVAFLSGAIIMNSLIMELPSDQDGRFLPFVAGGVAYGLLLLPLS
ncbi:MAG: hypothetical protein Q8R61_06470 [Thiobacillus sp.]|uniref:hypothetical protein n=1 Tax=Thiobacillus sp. TaxID=924 RepID=UPI002734615B|nr:hypothetical protein [Thiobacillus sp.]MDP3584748.1 hypothetical protein [Thiobacillus sp.]